MGANESSESRQQTDSTIEEKKVEEEVKEVKVERKEVNEVDVRKSQSDDDDKYAGQEPVVEEIIQPIQAIRAYEVMNAPCPPGYRKDAQGRCRKII